MMKETNLARADLNLLVLFEAVLRERHVGRAAEQLSLTSSAVSHGLNRLRQLLNDPLFLKTPKGVVPTARATALAEPIADILARARRVIATAEPFDPSRSARRFTIGMPDATAEILLPLLTEIRRVAPFIDISVRQTLRETAIAELDAHTVDIAIVPLDDIPKRFVERVLIEEEFIITTRPGHPFAKDPTLDRYCEMLHLIISLTGDPHAYIDDVLASMGRKRRIALTVPNFMLACAIIAETDLIGALPKSLVARHGARFGVVATPVPLRLRGFRIRAIAPKVAMMDAGLEWLFGLLGTWAGDVDNLAAAPASRPTKTKPTRR